MTSLFITGASGFIGKVLLKKLDPGRSEEICCLSRSDLALPESLAAAGNFRELRGGLFDSQVYAPYLRQGGTVLHLAALTGKAPEQEYFKVNVEGTKALLAECRRAGTGKFLYVSSISAKFPNISGYPYARSKVLAETAVRDSGLDYTIVRPTIVIGPKAHILKSLSALGKPPVIPMLGKGSARVQPIYVEDLAACLLALLHRDKFGNETLELGGPEQVSIENLVRIIRETDGQKPPLGVVHLPLKPLAGTLKAMEKLGAPLPFSAGQLSSFANEGVAETNPVQQQHAGSMKNVREMVGLSLGR